MKGLYVGVPVVIGAKGVERIIEIEMNAAEKKEFNASVASVRGLVDVVKKISAAAKRASKKAPKKASKKAGAKKAGKKAAAKK